MTCSVGRVISLWSSLSLNCRELAQDWGTCKTKTKNVPNTRKQGPIYSLYPRAGRSWTLGSLLLLNCKARVWIQKVGHLHLCISCSAPTLPAVVHMVHVILLMQWYFSLNANLSGGNQRFMDCVRLLLENLLLRKRFMAHWLIFVKDVLYLMVFRFNLSEFNFVLILVGYLPNDYQRACLFFILCYPSSLQCG